MGFDVTSKKTAFVSIPNVREHFNSVKEDFGNDGKNKSRIFEGASGYSRLHSLTFSYFLDIIFHNNYLSKFS